MAVSRFDYAQWYAKACAKRGEQLPQAKLNAEKVMAIRASKDKTAKQLAEIHGVHFRTIEKVRSFETWSHV